jgi:nucleoid-associated protein YgaU
MGREVFDAALIAGASKAAVFAVFIAGVVIFPALLAEVLDRIGRARGLARFLHRISPPVARRVAAVVLAASVVTTLGGRASAADEGGPNSVRRWLDSTATTLPVADLGATPSGTWYEDPGDPSGSVGPSGVVDFDGLNTHSSSTSLPATTSTTIGVTPTSRVSVTSATKRQTRRSPRARSSASTSTPPRARTRTSDPEFLPSESLLQLGDPAGLPDSPPLKHSVIHGDSLWSIAASRLTNTASDEEIDREWRNIYALNKELIGENPSLIFPGQVLELPPLTIT